MPSRSSTLSSAITTRMGSPPCTRVPPPARRPDAQPPAERLDAVGEAAQARAALGVGAADPVVDDLDDDLAVAAVTSTLAERGLRVLADVREALGDDVVGGHLERLGQPSVELDGRAGREQARARPALQRDGQAVAADDRRVHPARDVAQLLRATARSRVRAARARGLASGSAPSCFSSMLSSSDSATSRCWAPSCRLRSSRWRSFWPASITRAREPASSSRRALSSACSRAFSSAIPAAAPTASSSSGSSSSDASCTSAATGSPSRSISVVVRPSPALGQRHRLAVEVGPALELGQPVRELSDGSRSARASASRRSAGAGSPAARRARSPTRRAREPRVKEADQQCDGREPDHDERGPSDVSNAGPSNAPTQEQQGDHHQAEGERVDEQRDRAPQRPARRRPPCRPGRRRRSGRTR